MHILFAMIMMTWILKVRKFLEIYTDIPTLRRL